jgi:hypothetical protein
MSIDRIKVSLPNSSIGDWCVHNYNCSLVDIFDHFSPGTSKSHIGDENFSEYTVLSHNKFGLVMVDSQKEFKEHELLWHNAKGNILIGGLGIGMVNEKLINMPNITSVTIVEKSEEVIALVWPYCKKDKRFNLVQADLDIWEIPNNSFWDYAWFDTWLSTVNGDLGKYSYSLINKYSPYCDKIDFWPGFKGK